MRPQVPETGWEFVDQRDEAPALFRVLVALDPDEEYTRSEIADTADIPLKTLYLTDVIDDLVEIGVLERVDSTDADTEMRFALNSDSDVLAAARTFDEVVASASEALD